MVSQDANSLVLVLALLLCSIGLATCYLKQHLLIVIIVKFLVTNF